MLAEVTLRNGCFDFILSFFSLEHDGSHQAISAKEERGGLVPVTALTDLLLQSASSLSPPLLLLLKPPFSLLLF